MFTRTIIAILCLGSSFGSGRAHPIRAAGSRSDGTHTEEFLRFPQRRVSQIRDDTEAYETNRDPRYLKRAGETLQFVLSGWDEEGGGEIWWHQLHKDGTKNACANGPAAVGCLRLAKFRKGIAAAALVGQARKIVAWTVGSLEAEDGLFDDRKVVATGEIKRGTDVQLRAMLRACWASIGPRAIGNIWIKPSGSRRPRTGFWTVERAFIATPCGTRISWSRPIWNCTARRKRSTC